MSSPAIPLLARQRCALWGSVALASLLGACASPAVHPAHEPSQPVAAVKLRPEAAPSSAIQRARPGPAPAAEIDGPGLKPPPNPASVPDAEPVMEPIRLGGANKPYEAQGRSFVPMTEDKVYAERGLASWYGRKFHGRRTASGELYDMYAMTAAHPTLPLPSYVRVRNPANGNEVIVRINDRGPFHRGRVIDLSYTAAQKLDLLRGVGTVEIERITQEEIRTGSWRRSGPAADPSDATVDRQLAQRGKSPTVVAALAIPVRPVAVVSIPAETSDTVRALSVKELVPIAKAAAPAPAPLTVASTSAPVLSNVAYVSSVSAGTVTPLPMSAPSAGPFPAVTATAITAEVSGGVLTPAHSRGNVGYWVQIGAFKLRAGAETFQRKVVAELGWILPVLSVYSESELHRLQAGPYPSRDEANGVAQRVRDALSLVPLVVERQ